MTEAAPGPSVSFLSFFLNKKFLAEKIAIHQKIGFSSFLCSKCDQGTNVWYTPICQTPEPWTGDRLHNPLASYGSSLSLPAALISYGATLGHDEKGHIPRMV